MNQLQKNVFLTSIKTAFFLIATFFFGCIIATCVARMLDQSKDPASVHQPDPEDFRNVFVLKNTIRKGHVISPENVMIVQLHTGEVPYSAVKTFQQLDSRIAKSEITQGTVLLDEYFVPKITTSQPDGFIPPGFHSVAVQIQEVTTDGQNHVSAVQPGDQVDILVVQQNAEKGGDEPGEMVLLEKIPVLDTFWDAIGDFQRNEKKGTISLLLSDSQRQNLEENYQGGMKIRLRVCSPTETQTISELPPRSPGDLVIRDFYQTDNQPALISDSLTGNTSSIAIVFLNKQELKPIHQRETQISSLRGVSVGSDAVENAGISTVSGIDKQTFVDPWELKPPVPRYSSFFDASGQKGNTQWYPVVPRSPLVFEAPTNPDTKTRGVYRNGSVYYSIAN